MRILLFIALICIGQSSFAGRICFFEDINYRGASMCIPVGQNFDNLIRLGWNRRISSVSIEGTGVVDFYDGPTYTGNMGRVHFSLSDLHGVNFNDRATSIKTYVPAGRVCFFTDANYTNAYRCYFPGQEVPNFVVLNWNDMISSVRIDGDASAYLFQDVGFGGARFWAQQSVPDLGRYQGWNDRTSSARIVRASGQ